MSNLVPGLIPLENGLNLQTAKIAAPPGSSLDMLNYEQVDFVGQKRIDGYVRYDGNMEPVLDEYLVLTLDSMLPGSPGDLLYVDGEFWGRLLQVEELTIYVAVYNHKLTPSAEGSFQWDGDSYTALTVEEGKTSGVTAEEHYNNLLSYMNVLRSEVGELPPVAGLHWHEDRLYAVADVLSVVVNAGTGPCLESWNVGGYLHVFEGEEPDWWGVEESIIVEMPSGTYYGDYFPSSNTYFGNWPPSCEREEGRVYHGQSSSALCTEWSCPE